MSNKESDKIEMEGLVIKTLPGGFFNVKLGDEFGWTVIKAYISGKMRKNFINLIEWDTVMVELTPYDLTKWRITFRKK